MKTNSLQSAQRSFDNQTEEMPANVPVVDRCARDGGEILLLNDGDGWFFRCACCSVVSTPSKEQILAAIGD